MLGSLKYYIKTKFIGRFIVTVNMISALHVLDLSIMKIFNERLLTIMNQTYLTTNVLIFQHFVTSIKVIQNNLIRDFIIISYILKSNKRSLFVFAKLQEFHNYVNKMHNYKD